MLLLFFCAWTITPAIHLQIFFCFVIIYLSCQNQLLTVTMSQDDFRFTFTFSTFITVPPASALTFSPCLCLYLHITHSASSSITLTGLPPSHPSYCLQLISLFLRLKSPFIQRSSKRNTGCSTVSPRVTHSSLLLSRAPFLSHSFIMGVFSHPFSSKCDSQPLTLFLQNDLFLHDF